MAQSGRPCSEAPFPFCREGAEKVLQGQYPRGTQRHSLPDGPALTMQPATLLFSVPLGFLAALCPSMFLVAPLRPQGVGTSLSHFLPMGKLLGFLSAQPVALAPWDSSAPPPTTALPKCPSHPYALVGFHSLAPNCLRSGFSANTSILQINKLRPQEIRQLAQSHPAG